MMKIKRIYLGSSVQFRGREWNNFLADKHECEISFEKGIFTVHCPLTGESVEFGTSNARFWVPEREITAATETSKSEPVAAVESQEMQDAPKRRGRPPKGAA
jgi:hypothetical protein